MAVCPLPGEERTGGHLFGVIGRAPAPRGVLGSSSSWEDSHYSKSPTSGAWRLFPPTWATLHGRHRSGRGRCTLPIMPSASRYRPVSPCVWTATGPTAYRETCFLPGLPHSFWVECLGGKFPGGWNSPHYSTDFSKTPGKTIPPLSSESHSQGMFING